MVTPQIRRLEPHDPLPERGPFVLVLRRFGEDDPRAVVTEIILDDGVGLPKASVPAASGSRPADFKEALRQAVTLAEIHGIAIVHAVDRTAGAREREVLAHGGDHAVNSPALDDGDPAQGTDIRDRPLDAGYNLRPER
jgi:hypothetical protein